ncbi:MAG: Gfo/Idh/MocA family oxidoreductase, partial [Verrucomicrobia bacterium]|nr:Gfo/Idh/MocA family oxidoreductase [Verrucomicrobiota bacterium]
MNHCAMTRRLWLRQLLAAIAGASTASIMPRRTWARATDANGDIRVAFIGVRLRGPQLIGDFRKVRGVRIVGICDADSEVMAAEKEKLAAANTAVETVTDFRRLLDRKDVDAVVIATPDHWHALMTVWACQAGKDVYVEKPVSHNIWEGRQMVAAARKYGRIVQSGTQNRSDIGLQAAAEFLRQGGLGRIRLARVFDNVRRESIGKVNGPQPVPKTVDYDLFMGPAPLVPLRRKNLHYDWHFVWPTGTGDCGNRGVHCLDHAHWIVGVEGFPSRVLTVAGRLGYDDDGETPNSQITFFDTQPVPMLYELRSLPSAKDAKDMEHFRGIVTTMIIECEHGYLTGGRGGAKAFAPDGMLIKDFKGDSGRT